MLIGIDTSVFVGLLDSRDYWHPAATSLQEALIAAGLEFVYFDCVLAEAVSTLARRLREKRREGKLPDFWIVYQQHSHKELSPGFCRMFGVSTMSGLKG